MYCIDIGGLRALTDRYLWAKELRKQLKSDWAELWQTKYEDEVKAEGVSPKDFDTLFVERAEIIHATRKFKPLSFNAIYEKHVGEDVASKATPDPQVGGWRKFARKHFSSKSNFSSREKPKVAVDLNQQQRKKGEGWLNRNRIRRKTRKSRDRY